MEKITDTSIFIFILRDLSKWYGHLKQRINHLYQESQVYRLRHGLWKGLKSSFKYSFLGRISEAREAEGAVAVLNSSRLVQYLVNFSRRYKEKAFHYLRSSLLAELVKDSKEQLTSTPIRIISFIIITTLTVNLALIVLLQKQLSLWGALMRTLFLFVGASGLFCDASWLTLKSNSIFLRQVLKEK